MRKNEPDLVKTSGKISIGASLGPVLHRAESDFGPSLRIPAPKLDCAQSILPQAIVRPTG
jgi:hypothetical protein